MKILVTGCAGMIGSYLTSQLLVLFPKKEGNEIIGIDNLSRGKLANLKEACGYNFDDLVFLNENLTIFDYVWANYFKEVDIVIHLADIVAGIGYVFDNESYVFRTNLLINSNVSRAVFENKPKRYIYVGTACSFPKNLQLSTNSLPLVESDQFPALPESGYGWSKLMGEIEAGYLAKEGVTDSVILSLHNVYGKFCDYAEETSQVIPSLCLKALKCSDSSKMIDIWGDGNQGRAFIHASDVINAINLSFKKGANQGVIQIGPDKCTKIKDIAKIIISKINKNIKIKYDLTKPIGDIGRCANFNKAKTILGWEPKVSLDDGISNLVQWLKTKNI